MAHSIYRFGVFGHPVHHSLSPVMHAASFRALGLPAEYHAYDVPPEELPRRLQACQDQGFTGLNMTIPHKRTIMALLDHVDPVARVAGAVNTVRFDPEGRSGFNTDVAGFLADLKARTGLTPAGLRVLVLGCGGAGRAVALGCIRSGAKEILLANRTVGKADQLAGDLLAVSNAVSSVRVLSEGVKEWTSEAPFCDLVVQATSAGLRPEDPSALPGAAFRSGQVLYDLVTTPHPPTVCVAQASGATAVNGIGMLVHQGAAAFKIWTGLDADLAAMQAAVGYDGS